MDSFSIQSGSGQDYSGHATFQNTSYCFAFDGHGGNQCIDFIRSLDMNHFALLPCPPTALEAAFAGKHFYKSGATFVLARICENKLEVFHVGDAKARVYLNGLMVHETLDHTFDNPAEIARTTARIQPTKAPFPVSDTEVQLVDSPIGYFSNGEAFVPSQALGHNGVSGLDPGHYTLNFDMFDIVRVVCGTDGFWDMLPPTHGTAEKLCEEAVRRWKQLWTFGNVRTTYGDSIDDVSVAILDNTYSSPPSVCIPYSLNCFDESHVRLAFPFPIRRIDQVDIGDHKAFFLHFHIIDDELRSLLRNIRDRNVKLYYHDQWFWHLKLRGQFILLEQTFLDSGHHLDLLDDYIPHMTSLKMNAFTTTFLSS
jgi:serine/threonine protein phosphatase PrpC